MPRVPTTFHALRPDTQTETVCGFEVYRDGNKWRSRLTENIAGVSTGDQIVTCQPCLKKQRTQSR
jgi:hypothetical protein